jgi:hypothetical protein
MQVKPDVVHYTEEGRLLCRLGERLTLVDPHQEDLRVIRYLAARHAGAPERARPRFNPALYPEAIAFLRKIGALEEGEQLRLSEKFVQDNKLLINFWRTQWGF